MVYVGVCVARVAAHPGLSARFTDPAFALAFARIVTHYVRHDAWIEDESLLRMQAGWQASLGPGERAI